jgi:hypothetical protein
MKEGVLIDVPHKFKWVLLTNPFAPLQGFAYGIGVIAQSKENIQSGAIQEKKFTTYYQVTSKSTVIDEDVILLAGGLYNTPEKYIPIFDNYEHWNKYELSVSYDYGAELHSISMIMLSDLQAKGEFRFSDAWDEIYVQDKLQAFLDNFTPKIFPRGAAYAAVAAENFYRATGNRAFLNFHDKITHHLMLFEPRDIAYIDNIAATMWSLARAGLLTNDPKYILRAKEHLHRMVVSEKYADEESIKELSIYADNILWVFKAGILSRGLNAMLLAHEAGMGNFDSKEVFKMKKMKEYAFNYMVSCMRGGEIKTSIRSTETNSESQPWAILGLCNPDSIALRVCPRS